MELTIRIQNKKIYKALVQFLSSLNIEIVSQEMEAEEKDWQKQSLQGLAKAYDADEPNYDKLTVKEPNPDYKS